MTIGINLYDARRDNGIIIVSVVVPNVPAYLPASAVPVRYVSRECTTCFFFGGFVERNRTSADQLLFTKFFFYPKIPSDKILIVRDRTIRNLYFHFFSHFFLLWITFAHSLTHTHTLLPLAPHSLFRISLIEMRKIRFPLCIPFAN